VKNIVAKKINSWVVVALDDHEASLVLIQRILSHRPDVEVVTESNGNLGLDLIRRRVPDVVLLDLNLPGLSGESVLKEVRNDCATANVPVVMISGDVNETTKCRLREAGAQAFLEKPIGITEFVELMERFLVE
jgi:DNA-binding response OmpR family regulator